MPHVVGETAPDHYVLRLNLRDLMGVLGDRGRRVMPGGPLLAALIVIPITQGWAGLRELGSRMIRWRVRWYWYVVSIGLPLAVVLLTVGLNVALGASTPS